MLDDGDVAGEVTISSSSPKEMEAGRQDLLQGRGDYVETDLSEPMTSRAALRQGSSGFLSLDGLGPSNADISGVSTSSNQMRQLAAENT